MCCGVEEPGRGLVMFAPDDTIVAIATPSGRAGIGVVRLSGPDAPAIANVLLGRRAPLVPRHATFGRLQGGEDPGDEVIATWFPEPRSYTGQHVVEISAHGSPVVLQAIVRRSLEAGARLAQPGEFTLRAFLNGKRDLVQAEAVADLVAAATPLQARVACEQIEGALTRRLAAVDAILFDLVARLEASLDFPDEGFHFIGAADVAAGIDRVIGEIDPLLADAARGRLIRDGATVVIAGRPNVGKSSLFNALVGGERAIVTDVPGTTRDLITERIDLEGIELTLVDTAGSRETIDVVEREGVRRGTSARAAADAVIVVLDAAEPLTDDDHALLEGTRGACRVIAANKCDQPSGWRAVERARVAAKARPDEPLAVSARTGEGMRAMRQALVRRLTGGEALRDTAAVSNLRHVRLLEEARADLARARSAARRGDAPEEFLLVDLQAARARFDAIVGRRTEEDVLRHIFERFCVGK